MVSAPGLMLHHGLLMFYLKAIILKEQANTYYICLDVQIQNLKWLSNVITLFTQDMSLESYEPSS